MTRMASSTGRSCCNNRHIVVGRRSPSTEQSQLLMPFLGVTVVCLFVHAASAVQSSNIEPDFTNYRVSPVTQLGAAQYHLCNKSVRVALAVLGRQEGVGWPQERHCAHTKLESQWSGGKQHQDATPHSKLHFTLHARLSACPHTCQPSRPLSAPPMCPPACFLARPFACRLPISLLACPLTSLQDVSPTATLSA